MITYFYYHREEHYEELNGIQHIVSLYTMPLSLLISLFAAEALGTILGYFAFRGRYVKLGLLGMGLCTLCLVLLYGYSF